MLFSIKQNQSSYNNLQSIKDSPAWSLQPFLSDCWGPTPSVLWLMHGLSASLAFCLPLEHTTGAPASCTGQCSLWVTQTVSSLLRFLQPVLSHACSPILSLIFLLSIHHYHIFSDFTCLQFLFFKNLFHSKELVTAVTLVAAKGLTHMSEIPNTHSFALFNFFCFITRNEFCPTYI